MKPMAATSFEMLAIRMGDSVRMMRPASRPSTAYPPALANTAVWSALRKAMAA